LLHSDCITIAGDNSGSGSVEREKSVFSGFGKSLQQTTTTTTTTAAGSGVNQVVQDSQLDSYPPAASTPSVNYENSPKGSVSVVLRETNVDNG